MDHEPEGNKLPMMPISHRVPKSSRSPVVGKMARVASLSIAALSVFGIAAAAGAAPVKVDQFGTLPDGRAVQRYTLTNAHGMTVQVLSLGGIITEISVPDRNGHFSNVVLTQPDFASYARGSNFSSLLGRYANRIANGGFTLDGKRYDIAGAAPNGMILHGGPNGFSQQIWKVTPFDKEGGPSGLVLSHLSPDGTNGFPGNLNVTVRYTLNDDNTLRLDYQATTDKPTVLNLSHHVYFNLAGSNAGDASDQCVQINADHYAVAEKQVLTGEMRSVAGTPYDLRHPVRLGDRVYKGLPTLPKGYDTAFVINHPHDGLTWATRAWDPASGRKLEIDTTQTTVQFFTPPAIPGAPRPAAGAATGDQHPVGYAMETEHLPESPNHPEFPSTVLRPGQTFHSTTMWHFTDDAPRGACSAGQSG